MRSKTLLLVFCVGCSSSVSPGPDGSVDATTNDAIADAAADSPSSDASPADAAQDAAGDAGIIGQAQCAHSLACGQNGDSCQQADGGSCSTSCFCQSYGQPRCVAPQNDAGTPGAPCTSSNGCDTGLTCVQFGPEALCLHCGN